MNFSWPHRATGKSVRRRAARLGLVGIAAVTVGGAAALAAPGMSAMAATGTNPTTTVINLNEINTTPFGTWTYMVPFTVTDDVAGGPAPTGTVTITAPLSIPDQNPDVQFNGCDAAVTPVAGTDYSTGTCPVSTPTNSYGFVLMQANYSGDTENAPSGTGDAEYKLINLMPTETTVATASGTDTATAGTVDLVADVLPLPPIPPGNLMDANSETLPDQVSFTLDGAPIETCTDVQLGPPLGDPGPSFADCDVTLAAGTYTVTATFSGDEYAHTSSSTAVTLTVMAATTTTMSGVSGYVGSDITLAAKVAGGSSPTGTVSFVWGGKTLCSAGVSNGAAHCTHAFGGVGSFNVKAVYGGDATHEASSGVATVKVTAQPTSVKVTASPASTSTGKAVKLTATVKALSPATGTVTFYVGGRKLCTAKVSDGKASCSYTWHAAGTYEVTAVYSGNSTHLGSKGTASVTVKR